MYFCLSAEVEYWCESDSEVDAYLHPMKNSNMPATPDISCSPGTSTVTLSAEEEGTIWWIGLFTCVFQASPKSVVFLQKNQQN